MRVSVKIVCAIVGVLMAVYALSFVFAVCWNCAGDGCGPTGEN